MTTISPAYLARLAAPALALLLFACAGKPSMQGLFDLGPLATTPAVVASAPPAISLADLEAPAWLDSQAMHYRLAYANAQQLQRYSESRWTMAPSALLTQRLKGRIGQADGVVLSATDGAAQLPVLRLDLEDFSQVFTAPNQSHAQVAVRASLFNGRSLIAQKSFSHRAPAPEANAEGGAAAIAVASDAVITDIIAWLTRTRAAQ